MMFMPVASLLFEPKLAAVWLFVADDVAALTMLPAALRRCVWREVLPLAAGAVLAVPAGVALLVLVDAELMRSEEHTSELQSLMRISYAVFCLKKKKQN